MRTGKQAIEMERVVAGAVVLAFSNVSLAYCGSPITVMTNQIVSSYVQKY